MADNLGKSSIQKTPQVKQPPQRPKKIMAKEGQIKKRSFWQRMKKAFFVKDIGDVGKYLWNDVVLPAIKKLLVDSSNNAINMAVYGESRVRQNGATHVSQSSVYAGNNRNINYRGNRYHNIMEGMPSCTSELLVSFIDEALDEIARNGKISVNDFLYIVDGKVLPKGLVRTHTDFEWGWKYLDYECIQPDGDGYILIMPPAKPLN